jgi:hypothetical protein
MSMKIAVIDGQGGRIGQMIVSAIKKEGISCNIRAIGTNSTATAAMLKAGAHQGATGENPVIIACRKADVIIGPIGIVIADAIFGEVTPKMAMAVGQADATRILMPVNRCDNLVAGVLDLSMSTLIEDASITRTSESDSPPNVLGITIITFTSFSARP